MTIKKLITVPDELLRKKSQNIEKVSTDEKKLIKDLFETMYHHKGIGLAAIQVGIPKRIPSTLSKIPPCPGKIFPVSFIFAFLFRKEKKRSPIWHPREVNKERPKIFKLNIR